MFDTNVRIDRGYYGVAQKDKDGNEEFIRLGKAVTVERITRDIETDCVTLQLSWEYLGKKQIFEMPRFHRFFNGGLDGILVAGVCVNHIPFCCFCHGGLSP